MMIFLVPLIVITTLTAMSSKEIKQDNIVLENLHNDLFELQFVEEPISCPYCNQLVDFSEDFSIKVKQQHHEGKIFVFVNYACCHCCHNDLIN